MANVILVNRTKRPPRMLTYNLAAKTVKVVNRTTEETKDGDRRKRVSSKLVPGSVRVPAKGESEPIDESALRSPEVAAGIERREISVKKVQG